MTHQTRKLLEKAKAYCRTWRVKDAYPIFRRYFDRLPFEPELGHAEYMGWFARVLFELGKEEELRFYLSQLERLHGKTGAPFIAYPLAVVYSYSSEVHAESAKSLLEAILENPAAEAYHARASMMLADFHLNRDDILSAARCIDAIAFPQPDRNVNLLGEIWKAVIERRLGDPAATVTRLERVFSGLCVSRDWYSAFSARVVLAMAHVDLGDLVRAKDEAAKARKMISGRGLKMTAVQLEAMERHLRSKMREVGTIYVERKRGMVFLQHADRSLRVGLKSRRHQLLLLLLEGKSLENESIIRVLYKRKYEGRRDDILIYRHIHGLRKRLKGAGLPSEVIVRQGQTYFLAASVKKGKAIHA